MDSCRVVGPRGLCRPLDEKQGFPTNTSPLAPCQGCSKAEHKAGRLFEARQASTAGRQPFFAGSPPSLKPVSLEHQDGQVAPHIGSHWVRRPRAPGICQAGAPDPPGKTKKLHWCGIWGPSLLPNGKRSMAVLGHFSPPIPGGFTLPHRSDETLGRGPRSEPRAPMQMVSGALGTLGLGGLGFRGLELRVEGLGFRVWGLGFRCLGFRGLGFRGLGI